MFTLAPRWLPQITELARNLGADARGIARHLDVSERTVYHWMQHGVAPRTACLALFWETHEGRGLIADHEARGMALYKGLADSRAEEIERLQRAIDRMEGLDYGSANAPLWKVR